MTRNVATLMCVLIFAGFAALAAAELPSPAPVEQPSPELDAFLSQLAPAPTPMAGCPGGLFGPCNTSSECKGYFCPIGEIRYCFGSTGSGCEGSCGCW